MNKLNLDTALAIAQQTLAGGHARGFAPLTAAVLDAGGHVVALLRADGSSLLRPQIATGKPGALSASALAGGNSPSARRRCRPSSTPCLTSPAAT
jgi:uncharacterized protein GlcG (DUF336 family)